VTPEETTPVNEDGRAVAALHADTARVRAARRLVTTTAHPALDRLVGLAARLLGAPAAQVSLLSDVQTISAAAGLDPQDHGVIALANSLCSLAATAQEPFVVTDATADDRVAVLAPVTSGAVRAYLGVPMRGQDGYVVGALCVFSPHARDWSETDVAVLGDLAAAAVTELELTALAVDLEAARVRSELAVAAGGVGTFDWDLVTGELRWDERLLEMFGYAVDDFGRDIEAFNARLHPDDLPRVGAALQRAVEECGPFEAEYRVVRPDGATRWVRARGQALADEAGRSVRVLGAAYDTTAARTDDARVARVLESMASALT
jgi:PAS domain S-box-containing protein